MTLRSETEIAEMLAELSVDEKARLTEGCDFWNVAGIGRIGLPQIRVTDGPNGARGSALLGAGVVTAACVPCGSALGATWDPELVESIGGLLGREARSKSCRVLLAPTINLHRSPLAGRNFECYSEDPLLSGRLAAGFVRGVQSEGVAATPKHLVGNEAEHQRNTISSDIGERPLRELYLRPFELAVRDGGAYSVMTAYSRLNGRFCTEDPGLLTDILRREWGFDGVVMTDWFGIADTERSAHAGLDLEMPGPGRAYGSALAAAVRDGRVPAELLDAMAHRWLRLVDRVGAWDDPPPHETSIDLPEDRALARRAAADSIVLLRNDGILPIDPASGASVALLGPNASIAHIMGGGSAQLLPHHRTPPLDVLQQRFGPRLTHRAGCTIDRSTRPIRSSLLRSPDGARGIAVDVWSGHEPSGEPVVTLLRPDTRLVFSADPVPGVPGSDFSFRATATLEPEMTGVHTLTLTQLGRARVLVDGTPVLEGTTGDVPHGEEFFGLASIEMQAPLDLEQGRPVQLVIEYSSRDSVLFHGAKVGLAPPVTGRELDDAVAVAAASEVAVVIVGTSEEWETEGSDRTSMDLPGDQDELVRRVASVNPRTVVIVNAGAPVTMPWADDVAAILQVWLGGQEMAAAIDDVLVGDAEPAGRLPVSFPLRVEHNPTFGTFPGENDHQVYGEGLLVGYRWYETHGLATRYPFGHGGSYTTFRWEPATVSVTALQPGGTVTVEVPVTNTGSRRGAEVVQCYLRPAPGTLLRPARELVGWQKLWLDPGERAIARIELDERSFACWDPTSADRQDLAARRGAPVPGHGTTQAPRSEPGWWVDAGAQTLEIAASVSDIRETVTIRTDERRVGPEVAR